MHSPLSDDFGLLKFDFLISVGRYSLSFSRYDAKFGSCSSDVELTQSLGS